MDEDRPLQSLHQVCASHNMGLFLCPQQVIIVMQLRNVFAVDRRVQYVNSTYSVC